MPASKKVKHITHPCFVSFLIWPLPSLRFTLRNVLIPHENQPVFRRTLISGQRSHTSPDTSFPTPQEAGFMLSLLQTFCAPILLAPIPSKVLERDDHIIHSACSSPIYSFTQCSLGLATTVPTITSFVKVTSNSLVTKSCRHHCLILLLLSLSASLYTVDYFLLLQTPVVPLFLWLLLSLLTGFPFSTQLLCDERLCGLLCVPNTHRGTFALSSLSSHSHPFPELITSRAGDSLIDTLTKLSSDFHTCISDNLIDPSIWFSDLSCPNVLRLLAPHTSELLLVLPIFANGTTLCIISQFRNLEAIFASLSRSVSLHSQVVIDFSCIPS